MRKSREKLSEKFFSNSSKHLQTAELRKADLCVPSLLSSWPRPLEVSHKAGQLFSFCHILALGLRMAVASDSCCHHERPLSNEAPNFPAQIFKFDENRPQKLPKKHVALHEGCRNQIMSFVLWSASVLDFWNIRQRGSETAFLAVRLRFDK